jgi:diguanylate cyclase (GGDEF)-like protein
MRFYEPVQRHAERLREWARAHGPAIRDLAVLTVLGLGASWLLISFDMLEAFHEFSRAHEDWELDDIVLSGTIVFSVCAMIFSLRRWREAAELLRQANTDVLTGLANRRKCWDILELESDRARRYQRPLSLIMFDLDRFKNVNDVHGHDVGDEVLKSVARTVQAGLRASDTLTRWGGEEFMIVCVESDIARARLLAERLRAAVERSEIPVAGHITASFGVAQLGDDKDLDVFIRRVDDRLYEAKSAGRNRVA